MSCKMNRRLRSMGWALPQFVDSDGLRLEWLGRSLDKAGSICNYVTCLCINSLPDLFEGWQTHATFAQHPESNLRQG